MLGDDQVIRWHLVLRVQEAELHLAAEMVGSSLQDKRWLYLWKYKIRKLRCAHLMCAVATRFSAISAMVPWFMVLRLTRPVLKRAFVN